MTEREHEKFEGIDAEWSRPRKLTRVLAQLGHAVPKRLTRSRLEALVVGLRSQEIEMGTLDGEPIEVGASGVSIHAKVRLRRRQAPLTDAVLSAVSALNFKSFSDAKLPLSELTVLIGANASGKSNALEALQLLSWLSGGQRLSQLRFDVKDRKLGLRGTTADLFRIGQEGTSFRLGCSLEPDANGRSLELTIELGLDGGGLRVLHEELTCPEASSSFPLYRVAEPAPSHGREIQVEYNNFAKGGKKPQVVCVDEMPVFTQLVTPARFGATHEHSQKMIPRAARRITDALSKVLFLDPDPRSMRGYTHRSETTLGGDGTNLSGVLYHLTEDQGCKQEVLDFIQALPEQDILDIQYVLTPRDEIMVRLVESFGGAPQPTDAVLLSDGTLRVLAIAAALLSVPEGALVVIEEIDNGVHPSRAEGLMRRIQEIATRRHLRVLLTTHNPALLDSVPTAALPHVVASFRDPENGSSRLVRLQDLPTYPELVARGRLGHLVTEGILDRFLKDASTEEERQAQRLRWFSQSFGEGA